LASWALSATPWTTPWPNRFSPAWKANYSPHIHGRTPNQPANAIFEWINAWDNRRRHSALGYLSPIQYEQAHHTPAQKHFNGQNVQAIADLDELVVDVGEPVPGTRHDGAAFWLSGIAERWHDYYQPGGMGMTGDRGYIGCGIITPERKPPGGGLSDYQKAYNRSVNQIRAAVERAIAHLKNWKILKTGYHRIMHDFPICYAPSPCWRSTEPAPSVLNDPQGAMPRASNSA